MSLVSVDGLTVRTEDGGTLLEDVSVALEAEETVLLAGASGSGKSLLSTAIAGLLDDQPTLTVTGSVSRTGSVGVLFQNPKTQLVRRRVRQDIAFGLENRGIDPEEIHHRIDTWAERLRATPLLDREIEELSRGETTIVALLGTLVTEPDLVILDEPLAPLDAHNRRRVLEAIDELRPDTALLVTEHDTTELLARTDRVIHLENGSISARGDPRTVLPTLRETAIKLPFATAVELARGTPLHSVPLSGR